MEQIAVVSGSGSSVVKVKPNRATVVLTISSEVALKEGVNAQADAMQARDAKVGQGLPFIKEVIGKGGSISVIPSDGPAYGEPEKKSGTIPVIGHRAVSTVEVRLSGGKKSLDRRLALLQPGDETQAEGVSRPTFGLSSARAVAASERVLKRARAVAERMLAAAAPEGAKVRADEAEVSFDVSDLSQYRPRPYYGARAKAMAEAADGPVVEGGSVEVSATVTLTNAPIVRPVRRPMIPSAGRAEADDTL
ncbi:MAG: SIMPL domain-containing protein [Elusimicrobia bacterium]|nr:SIMPL domain-containing protein [Elusimicrobiota bacterium]